nr:MAG TPA: hypothetical protein [Caudoviricetes sp.]
MTDNQITKEEIIDATASYYLTYYMNKIATNMESNKTKERNIVLHHLRYSMYKSLLKTIQDQHLSIYGLQQQIAEWKTIRKIKDIKLLLPNANTEELTKADLQNVRLLVREIDQIVKLVITQLTKVLDKCDSLVDKQEPTQEDN